MVAEPVPNQQAFAVRLGPIDELRPPVTNDPIVDDLYLTGFEPTLCRQNWIFNVFHPSKFLTFLPNSILGSQIWRGIL